MTNLNEKLFLDRDKGISLEYSYDVIEYKDEFHFIKDMIETFKLLFKIVEPLVAEICITGSSKEDYYNKAKYNIKNRGWKLE